MADDTLFRRVYDHLMDEAALLDARDYLAWHATLDPDIRYEVYAHLVRMLGEEGPRGAPLLLENHASLRTRCEQLMTPGFSVADNPPAAVRHFVTNVRVRPGTTPDTCTVGSNVLIYRVRGADTPPHLLSAARADVLRDTRDGLRLTERIVRCDEAVIGTRNLTFFF